MIRKATNKDIDFIYSLYMHPAINRYLLYEEMSRDNFQPVFEELLSKDIKFIYTDEGTDAGMFKLIPLTYRTSHIVYLGGVAIHPSFAGKGHGRKMLQEIIDLAKRRNFSRIELSVAVINEKAIQLYEKCGFEKEGVLKKYTWLQKENKFLDEVLMACLL